jgi:purine-binding chemotaxis protein CheW
VTVPSLTRVPGAPAHLQGVFAHRGEVIPVVDLTTLTSNQATPGDRAVLLRMPEGSFAIVATRVAGVSAISGSLTPMGSSGVHMHLRGPAQASSREVAVIELQGLFEFLKQSA